MTEHDINEKQNCSLCNYKSGHISIIAEEWLIKEIKKYHPEWTGEYGICRRCMDYYYNLLDNVQVVN